VVDIFKIVRITPSLAQRSFSVKKIGVDIAREEGGRRERQRARKRERAIER
jgi:hypothetical protein